MQPLPEPFVPPEPVLPPEPSLGVLVPSLGVLDCGAYDTTFARAVAERVVRPLGARGIEVPPEDLAAVRG